MKRLKVLISAYSCEPGRGSEPGVGWNVVCEVAKYHDVWVLTRPDESKAAIETELERTPNSSLKFVYFTLPFWQDSQRWGQSGAMQLHYYLWQVQAYFVARRLHKGIDFDIVHHVTFVKYSTPSFLSLLPVPFVWGPVGGGESAPAPFWRDFSFRARAYEYARNLARGIGEHDPFVPLTARRSTVVQATTQDTAQRLQKMGARGIDIQPEAALSDEDINQLGQLSLPVDQPLRFISMGRLLHWKGFHLGIRGFAEADIPNAEYWVCGDGQEMESLKKLARSLDIENHVKFWGYLPREQALDKLRQCHVLVHPSLHDSGGWVCPEGMAAGRPIICLDLGGPAARVPCDAGFKVPARNPDQATKDIAAAMRQLSQNPILREKMGTAGKQAVRQSLSWSAKGQNLIELYDAIADKAKTMPCTY